MSDAGYHQRVTEAAQRRYITYAARRCRALALLEVARQDMPLGEITPEFSEKEPRVAGQEETPPNPECRLNPDEFLLPDLRVRAQSAVESGLGYPAALQGIHTGAEWTHIEVTFDGPWFFEEIHETFAPVYERTLAKRSLPKAALDSPDAAWAALRRALERLFAHLVSSGVLPPLLKSPLQGAAGISPLTYARAGLLAEDLLTPLQQANL